MLAHIFERGERRASRYSSTYDQNTGGSSSTEWVRFWVDVSREKKSIFREKGRDAKAHATYVGLLRVRSSAPCFVTCVERSTQHVLKRSLRASDVLAQQYYRINHKCVPPQCTEGSGRTAHRAGGPVRTKRGIAYLRGLLAFSVVG